AETATPRQAIAVTDLPRLNVSAIRAVEGDCNVPARVAVPRESESRTSAAQPRPPEYAGPAAFPAGTVTVVGCLIRAPEEPGAPQDRRAARPLIVVNASILDSSREAATRSAVPGSLPSGDGTGTVRAPNVSRAAPRTSSDESPLSFAMDRSDRKSTRLNSSH